MSRKRRKPRNIEILENTPTPKNLEPLFRAAFIREREKAKDAAWHRLSGYEKKEAIEELRRRIRSERGY